MTQTNTGGTAATPNPLDAIIAKLAADPQHQNGLALSLERHLEDGEKSLSITVSKALPEADEWRPPAELRSHHVNDVASLVAMAKKYGTAEKSLIMIDQEEAVLIIDETIQRGERETVSLGFTYSDPFDAWNGVVGSSPIDQKEFKRLVANHAETIDDPQLIKALSKISYSATVKRDTDLRDEGETFGVVFTTSGGDSIASIPKSFCVTCPVLLDDDAEGIPDSTFEVRIEVLFPTNPTEVIRFQLVSPDMNRKLRDRIRLQMQGIRDDLEGWTIVYGRTDYTAVKLGRPKS